MPKGILRNAPPPGTYDHLPPVQADLDRSTVLENTLKNAALREAGDSFRKESSNDKTNGDANDKLTERSSSEEERLKWDEANLYLTEQEKTAKMKIDEPKTPFQGPVGSNEYYLPDDDIVSAPGEEPDDFSLGEPEYPEDKDSTIQNDRIIPANEDEDVDDEEQDDDDDEDDQDKGERLQDLSPEEKHRRFEQMRKEHYLMKGDVLKHPPPIDDEEDEDEN